MSLTERDNIEENQFLVPTQQEINRRIADELHFIERLLDEMTKEPEFYFLGQHAQDLTASAVESKKEIKELIGLLGADSSKPKRRNDQFVKEGLSGTVGEAKTNLWRNMRDRFLNFLLGKKRNRKILIALSEYLDYGKTVIESVEVVVRDNTKIKFVSELLGYLSQLTRLKGDKY
ncbi:MAG: hypothetical protein ACR2QW_13055 [bacterium]